MHARDYLAPEKIHELATEIADSVAAASGDRVSAYHAAVAVLEREANPPPKVVKVTTFTVKIDQLKDHGFPVTTKDIENYLTSGYSLVKDWWGVTSSTVTE